MVPTNENFKECNFKMDSKITTLTDIFIRNVNIIFSKTY